MNNLQQNQSDTKKNMQFADIMLEEVGLYRDIDGTIMDQETDSPITLNGKTLVYPFDQVNNIDFRTSTAFDPLDNPSLSRYMFGYFLDQHIEGSVDGFHTIPDKETKDKSTIVVESAGTRLVESGSYYSDPVKYVDAMMRLNGMDNPDLTSFDGPIERKQKRRKK